MRTTKEIITDYRINEKLSQANPADGDPRSRPGREIAVADATSNLLKLKREYAQVLKVFPVFVFGSGDSQTKLAKLIRDEGDVMSIDGAALYKRFVQDIRPTIGPTQTFSAEQLGTMIRTLRDLAAELDIAEFMQGPTISRVEVVHNDAEIAATVRRILNDAMGTDLLVIHVARQVRDQALAEYRTERALPVFIVGLDVDDAAAVGTRAFTGQYMDLAIDAKDTLDAKFATTVFELVSKKMAEAGL